MNLGEFMGPVFADEAERRLFLMRLGGCMVIRPMAAAYAMGEIGRSAGTTGAKGGPTSFLREIRDEVSLGARVPPGTGLYSASPLFKMTGAVELTSSDILPG